MPQKTPSAASSTASSAVSSAVSSDREIVTLPSSPIVDSQSILSKTEASAKELMDSVFEDVDYMLDKGVSLVPTSTPAPPSQDEQGLVPQDGAIASTIDIDNDNLDALASSPFPLADEWDAATPPDETDQAWGQAVKIALPILGACAALGVALAAGFILHSPWSPWARDAIADAGNTNPVDSPDTEFASYMQRALDTIASSETSVSALASRSGDNANDNTPESTFPGSADNTSFRSSGIPQRVYIPVYQPPSPSVSPLPSVPIQSSVDSPPDVVSTPLPTPPTPAATSSESASSPAASSPSPIVSTPTPSPTPAPTPVPAPVSPAPISSSPIVSDLSHEHVLVGLLQLGDRSVAMFDFSEGTHRVRVGEQIGNSGWSLVSVSQNEAVIRRNGDVRSIYIGQSF